MSDAVKTHYSTCTLCEAMCGIEVKTQDRKILSIAGDRSNPFSQGHVCPKASALRDLYDDPDRIRTPMRKTQQGWQPISWDEAYDLAAQKLFNIQQKHGVNSIGVYLGNPNAHNFGAILFGPYFYRALQTKNRFSATSVDQLPHHIVSRKLFGHQLQIPIPDIDHTQHFIIIGGNPLASNGSIMTVPHIKKRLKAIQQRKGKVVVIDPKLSETAEMCSEHHFICPGTDVLLLSAMLNTLFANNWVNTAHLNGYLPDISEFNTYFEKYTPERVANRVGIAANDIVRLVKEFVEADSAVCYGRMGASTQVFGTLTQYLIMLFNIFTGNLNKRGGAMFTQPAADTLPHSGRGSMGKGVSRVRQLPSFAGEYPAVAMAEEMITPGDGQIKAMVVAAGNPVLTTPNGQQLDKAFADLEFVLAIDFYINETTRHADLILPPVTALQRDHYDVVFHNFAVRNSAKFSPALFPMSEQERTDWQIYLSLAERLDKLNGKATAHYAAMWLKTPTGVVDDMLTSGRYAQSHMLSIDKLLSEPHGIDLGALQPDLPNAIYHQDKNIDLALDYFLPDLERVEQFFFATEKPKKLLLIGRRHLKSNNSWLHNNERMLKGSNRCSAQIHPRDAQAYSIIDGQQILVRSRVGQITISAEVTDKIMQGVISIPHGWGHHFDDTQWQTAQKHAGVSCNDLTDDLLIDALSGNAAVNGVPVSISAV